MDIVPTPMSNPAPQVAVSPVNPVPQADPDIAAQTAPALDRLNNAFQQGLVTSDDLQKLFIGGTEMAKAGPLAAADIQAAKLRQQVQPEAAKTEIQAQQLLQQTQPVAAQAEIAKSKAATAASQLLEQDSAGKLPIVKAANLDALSVQNRDTALDQMDPSETLKNNSHVLSSWGIPTPMHSNGSIDVETLNSQAQSLIRYQNQFKYGVWPDLIKQAAGKQKGFGLLFNADRTVKDPIQASLDVANALPQQNIDDRNKSVSQLQMLQGVSDVAPQILSILNNPNPRVGPQAGQGDDVSMVINKARAFVSGNDELKKLVGGQAAVDKLNDQQVLRMYLANQIQTTIRSLAGSGNRVMQAEVNPQTGLFYTAMPRQDASPEVWKTWLGNQLDTMKRASEETLYPMNPDDQAKYKDLVDTLSAQSKAFGGASQVALAPAPAPASPASPAIPRAPQLSVAPVANTADAIAKLGRNVWYNHNGQLALTPP